MFLEAAFWGLLAASTLLIGAFFAFRARPSSRVVGLVMGFGAGALIAAVAYDLFPEEVTGNLLSYVMLGLGAVVFYYGSSLIDRRSARNCTGNRDAKAQTGEMILLGALLDGIPESLVLGMTFAIGGGVSIAFLGAVLVSNLPEGIAGSAEMECGGMDRRRIYLMWLAVMVVCVLSTIAGAFLIQIVPAAEGVYIMALAGGAVLAMLADSMMPEGYQEGGRATALMVVLGFAFAALLGTLS